MLSGSAKRQEKRAFRPPHPSLLSYIRVSVKCGFLVWRWGGYTVEGPPVGFPLLWLPGCGETGLGVEALGFDAWTRSPPNDCSPFENYR